MAIDTAAKRSSCLDFEEVWTAGIPLPDGAVGQADRQHLLWSYSGILVSAVEIAPETVQQDLGPRTRYDMYNSLGREAMPERYNRLSRRRRR